MIIKRKTLARRTFLKGLGVSIGLPYLEIMCAKESFAQENITRTAWVYVPNGWYKNSGDFFPSETGSNYSSTPFLAPILSHRNDFMVISNLDNAGGRAGNDGPGDHARAAGTYLSSVRILKDQDNKDFVYIASPGKKKGEFKVTKVFVTVIEKFEGEALIKPNEKVKSGQKIVVEGARGIANGDQVRAN